MYQQPFPNIFRPLKVGSITIKNRLEIAPAIPMLASEDGFVTDALIAYTENLARSGAGIVTIGDSAVDFEFAKEHLNQLNLGDYRIVPGLSRLVNCIHRHGAVASIEVNHGGRFTAPIHLNGKLPIGPSNIQSNAAEQFRDGEGRESVPVHEMTKEEIRTVVAEFATAAKHCVQAGFKMIMIHGGHGHLIAQYFSPLSNKRTDEYGGSFENRIRFAKEVLTAIREAVGGDLVIEMRVSADEMVEEGFHFPEAIRFVQELESLIDIVHVSYGNICEPRTSARQIPPSYYPRAMNAEFAVELKKHVNIPIASVGGFNIDLAESYLADDKIDIVAMMRGFLADDRLAEKARRGEADRIRPCLRCDHCTQNTSRFYPILCAVNPVIGRELELNMFPPASKKKKVVIIGGGPAGMQAAITAADRGHEVLLFEKQAELGGALRIAAKARFKEDIRNYLSWLIQEVYRRDIAIKTDFNATPEFVDSLNADAVLVAIGAEPIKPLVPGQENAVLAEAVEIGSVKVGDRAVIIGSGLTGLECALSLLQEGKKVTVVGRRSVSEFGRDCNNIARIGLFQLLEEYKANLIEKAQVQKIQTDGVVISENDTEWLVPADTVILATGYSPRTEEALAFNGTAVDVYRIGDCTNVATVKQAVHAAFDCAMEL